MIQGTIYAIAATQDGAIGSIRVSDPEAISTTDSIFGPIKAGKLLSEQRLYALTFGHIYDGDEVIDEVLVSLFRTPRSYTGKDSMEIMYRGSTYILQQVMQLLIKNGCRMVQSGEYTQRALLNGEMDLSQAGAVADLVASSSVATRRLIMGQIRGGSSRELTNLRSKLLSFTSMIESELGFNEEDVEFADHSALGKLADEVEQVISWLVHLPSVNNAIRSGAPVATIGETDAGKSTLLDVLLSEDKAVVSDVHGTTCDVIGDAANIGGITFQLINIAGIRETSDTTEGSGIEHTFQKLDQAETVLWMIDAVSAVFRIERLSEKIVPRCEGKHLTVVSNRVDLVEGKQKEDLSPLLEDFPEESTESIFISAKRRENTNGLQEAPIDAARLSTVTQNDIIVTDARYYETSSKASEAIRRMQNELGSQVSGDLLSQDMRECIFFISDIAGEVANNMILQNIFQCFCIGK